MFSRGIHFFSSIFGDKYNDRGNRWISIVCWQKFDTFNHSKFNQHSVESAVSPQQMGNASDRGNFLKYRNRWKSPGNNPCLVERKTKPKTQEKYLPTPFAPLHFRRRRFRHPRFFSYWIESRNESNLNGGRRNSFRTRARAFIVVCRGEPWAAIFVRGLAAGKAVDARDCATNRTFPRVNRKFPSKTAQYIWADTR